MGSKITDDPPVTNDERERIAERLWRTYFAAEDWGLDQWLYRDQWYKTADLAISLGARLPVEYVDGALYEITDGPYEWKHSVVRRRGDHWTYAIGGDPVRRGVPNGCTFTRLVRETDRP